MLGDFCWNFERLFRPSQIFLHFLQIFCTERGAVATFGACERGTEPDDRLADDERRFIFFGFRLFYGAFERVHIVGVVHFEHLPALRLESRGHVLGKGAVGISLDGDIVVVVKENEFSQFMGTRERASLIGNALFQTAVAAQHVRIVIHHGEAGLIVFCGQMRLCERHAHAVGDALAERARRRFHAGGMAVFGMARRLVTELAEVL